MPTQMLDNIFEPLFEVTRNPASHPQLHVLLQQVRCAAQGFRALRPDHHAPHALAGTARTHDSARAGQSGHTLRSRPHRKPCMPVVQVVGFDMVDDESKPERRPTKHSPAPAEWSTKHNCAYSYYAYYMYANLYVLNKFR